MSRRHSSEASFFAHSIQRDSYHKIEAEDEIVEAKHDLPRILIAEGFGMLVMMIFGLAANVQTTLLGIDPMVVWCSWGFAVFLGIVCAGHKSGAHLNPAVTLALLVFGIPNEHGIRQRMSKKVAGFYVLVQFIAAFIASGIVFLEYYQDIQEFDGGSRMIRGDKATAGVFGTLPRSGNGVWSLLFDQILGTALLLVIVSAVSDGKRLRKIMPENSGAGIVALTVILVGFSLGMNCGYPMNPARDLAPRIFSAMAGYGKGVFQVDPLGYWWISVVGPCIGALLGAGAYRLCIDNDDLF